MSARRGRIGRNHRARGGEVRRRSGRLIGSVTVGAFLAVGMTPLATAPSAHADIDDLFQPIIDMVDQIGAAIDPSLAGDFDPGFDADSLIAPALSAVDFGSLPWLSDPLSALNTLVGDAYQVLVYDPVHQVAQLLTAAEAGNNGDAWGWLFGGGGVPAAADTGVGGSTGVAGGINDLADVPNPAAGTAAATDPYVTVPLDVKVGTEPAVTISVGGGTPIDVLVDTGSRGLVMPIWDIGWQNLGFPTGMGFGAYSGGLSYFYLTVPTTVDFGNGIVTGQTDVNAVLFGFPTTLEQFLAPAGVQGVLGIGPNAVGPEDHSPIDALPNGWNQGVYLDQGDPNNPSDGVMGFGPNPMTGDMATIAGAPIATLWVSINGADPVRVPSIIDNGGVYGTMPASVVGNNVANGYVAPGTHIAVYDNAGGVDDHDVDKHLLYEYTTNSTNAPQIISSGKMNTGNIPFQLHPVYISNVGNGETVFSYSGSAITP